MGQLNKVKEDCLIELDIGIGYKYIYIFNIDLSVRI